MSSRCGPTPTWRCPGLARIVADFLEALDLRDAVLVANDSGVAITQQTAADHPQRIGALVLTSGDAYERFFPPLFRYLKLLAAMPGSIWVMAQSLRIRALWRLPLVFGWLAKRPIPEEVVRAWSAPLQRDRRVRRDFRRVLRAVSPRYTLEVAPRLAAFDQPALLAWAREDRVFPLEIAERLAATLPNAQLSPIEDSYSFVPEDQPERLAELIRQFLRESAPTTASA